MKWGDPEDDEFYAASVVGICQATPEVTVWRDETADYKAGVRGGLPGDVLHAGQRSACVRQLNGELTQKEHTQHFIITRT